MATKIIAGTHTEKIDVATSGNTWHLVKNALINTIDFGFYGEPNKTNNVFNIDGDIKAVSAGVIGQGNTMTVNLGASGSLQAQYGVYMTGGNRLDLEIDGDIMASQYAINSTALRTTIDVGRNASIHGAAGISALGAAGFTAQIDGEVFGSQYGLLTAAANAKVNIGNHGSLEGLYAIYLIAADPTVVNHGSVSGSGGYGVYSAVAGLDLHNSGDISGIAGVVGTGDGVNIVNEKGGLITGQQYAIVASTSAGNDFKVVNHGSIVAPDVGLAFSGSAGDEKIINDGRIIGGIALADGNDVVDTLGGTIKGQIAGGAGNDTLITDKASHKLVENAAQGVDTVKSTVTYTLSAEVEKLFLLGGKDIDGTGNIIANTLHGNSGDNVLKGLAGADDLFGHKGTDQLFGGGDADVFHFSSGDGKDTVMDLTTAVDKVDLSGWNAINNFMQLLAHADNDGHGNVVIEAGNDSLTIHGYLKGDLDTGDFTF